VFVWLAVVQTDPPPLTALEMLLELWRTVSVIIYAASAFLVICLLVVIIIYAAHHKYVQYIAWFACSWWGRLSVFHFRIIRPRHIAYIGVSLQLLRSSVGRIDNCARRLRLS